MDPLSRRAMLAATLAAGAAAVVGCRREPETPVEAGGDLEGPKPEKSPRPPLPSREPLVRVRVARIPADGVPIGGKDQWIRMEPAADASGAIVVKGPVTAQIGPGGWTVVDAHGFQPALLAPGVLHCDSIDTRHPDLVVGGRAHPGRLRLVPRTDSGPRAFDVVNVVPVESYLSGVIASELFGHWHLQTFMAQAIAARSFACAEHAYFADRRHYDLSNTTRSQVYAGGTGLARAIDAVAMTRGQVLGWEDALVPGYYSSCCGGRAASAVDVIGTNPINDVAPLRGRDGEDVCTEAPVYAWSVKRPVGRLSKRIAAWGTRQGDKAAAGLGTIESVEVTARNPHGRPTEITCRDTEGNVIVLDAERFRRAANRTTRSLPLPAGRLKSSFIDPVVHEGSVVMGGHGFGHGAGLCQYGAQQLATDGRSAEEIIAWYYPEAEIIGAYL